VLLQAERAVSLLERCRPLNAQSEHERLLASYGRGVRALPAYRYAPPSALSELERHLCETAHMLDQDGEPVVRLYAERARELALEARLSGAVGAPEFERWAARRYPEPQGQDAAQALSWAASWAAASDPDTDEPRHLSDDEQDPESVVSRMRALAGMERLPYRVMVSDRLSGAAAVGHEVLLVQRGLYHTAGEAERIALHEVRGHALPRHRAAREPEPLFAVASARGIDEEEGRALLLEERASLLGAARRTELGRRHLAALSVRRGADYVETVELLRGLGSDLESALRLSARVHRGGGLARELVYLPNLVFAKRGLADDPSLEAWVEHGRLSLSAAAVLRAHAESGRVDGRPGLEQHVP
jgi:hypothetical protein